MFNSTDPTSRGHGFFCLQCRHVEVANSTFEGLESLQGGAIFLQYMDDDSVTEIWNNTFYRNQASRDAGAIRLTNAGRVYILGNNFTENRVVKTDKSWRFSDGGALYYAC